MILSFFNYNVFVAGATAGSIKTNSDKPKVEHRFVLALVFEVSKSREETLYSELYSAADERR